MKNLKLTALTATLLILSVPAMSMTEKEVRQIAGLEDETSEENIEKEIKEKIPEAGHDTSQTSISHNEIEEKVEKEEKEIRKGKEDRNGLFSALLNLF